MSLVTLNTHNAKATYNTKHVIGSLLTVSEGKSVIILEGILVASRQHDTGAVAESKHVTYTLDAESTKD